MRPTQRENEWRGAGESNKVQVHGIYRLVGWKNGFEDQPQEIWGASGGAMVSLFLLKLETIKMMISHPFFTIMSCVFCTFKRGENGGAGYNKFKEYSRSEW